MAIYESLYDNDQVALKAQTHLRALPTFRDNGWRPLQPWQWPDMRDCCFISHDTENKELDFDNGAGWAREAVIPVGHSLTGYWRDGTSKSLYLPMRHEVDAHLNLNPDTVTRYVRDQLHTAHIPKGYANGIYDIGTSTESAIYVQGTVHEIQFAESLLSEDENVALEVLAKKWLGEGKDSNEMYEWSAQAYGGNPTGAQRANIYRISPMLVGPYAEQDSALIRPILWKQWQHMDQEQLLDLYRMECKLIKLLVRMRMQGCRIDLPYIDTLSIEVDQALKIAIAEFHVLTGIHTSDSCPTGDIAKAFDKLGIPYRITDVTKKPSITADDLKLIPHRVAALALEIRQLGKVKSTFIEGTLRSKHLNGILHGSFEPMRGEAGTGARTGRFVSNNPNLQTIPVRTELGKKIRKAFIPFDGHHCFTEQDVSQYEYRLLANFSVDRIGGTDRDPIFGPGPTSNKLRERYRTDPDTDYHDQTRGMILEKTGKILERKPTKTVNFGLMNLMGIDLLAFELSLPTKEVRTLLDAYHEANPYVKASAKHFEREAQRTGYVKTAMGRRRRFNLWEPKPQWDDETKTYTKWPGLRYQHALATYGQNIQRARCHTALNSITQGSNADGIKAWMVNADDAGVFDVIGVPLLTVHDALGFSQIDNSPRTLQAFDHLKHLGETALPMLTIPIRVDTARGPNWGTLE